MYSIYRALSYILQCSGHLKINEARVIGLQMVPRKNRDKKPSKACRGGKKIPYINYSDGASWISFTEVYTQIRKSNHLY